MPLSIFSFLLRLRSSARIRPRSEVEGILAKTPGVKYTTSVIGFSLLSYVQTSYNAFFFVTLKPWTVRTAQAEQFQAIKQRLNQELGRLPQGTAFQLFAAGDSGRGHVRRLHICARRSRRA